MSEVVCVGKVRIRIDFSEFLEKYTFPARCLKGSLERTITGRIPRRPATRRNHRPSERSALR